MARWKPGARERLVVAAADLFSEQGYDATTVTQIAARAGVTKSTLFRHFPDKREILVAGQETLSRLREQRYLDDKAFAADYTRLRQEGAKFGRRRVQQDLQTRGVEPELIRNTLDEAYAETDELTLALAYLERKRLKPPADEKGSARVSSRHRGQPDSGDPDGFVGDLHQENTGELGRVAQAEKRDEPDSQPHAPGHAEDDGVLRNAVEKVALGETG